MWRYSLRNIGRRLAGLLLVLSVLLVSAGPILAQEAQVVQHETSAAIYSFTIPGTHPVERPVTVHETPLGPITVSRVMAMNTAFPVFSFQASIAEYPPGFLAGTTDEQMLVNVLTGVFGNMEEFQLLAQRPVVTAGFPGLEADISMIYLGTRVHSRNRLCRVGNNILMLTFGAGIMENRTGDPTLLDDPSGMAYLDSLTIVPAAVASAVTPTCSLTGSWQGVFPPSPSPMANQPATFLFSDDGQLSCTAGEIAILSTWTAEGAAFRVLDSSSIPPQIACDADETGLYALTFNPECTQVSFSVVNEPCRGRSYSLNGLALTHM